MGPVIAEVMGGCNAILLGRNTFEMFAPAWSARTADDDPGAPFMNDTTKFVVSSTLENVTWSNSTIVGPYDAEVIRRIKDRVEGGIYLSGSGTLARALIADGLVDEVHLFVYPLTRGSGPRLFPPDSVPTKWSLARSDSFDNGVVYLGYRLETG
jgi:dihydrofolate reductase